MGPETLPEFPWVRFDSGHLCYNEALIDGRYLFAGSSAMGRPMSRAQVLAQATPRDCGVNIPFPWTAREEWECAFGLTIGGQTLLDGWEWVGAEEIPDVRPEGPQEDSRGRKPPGNRPAVEASPEGAPESPAGPADAPSGLTSVGPIS
jgi:hypothetical protein